MYPLSCLALVTGACRSSRYALNCMHVPPISTNRLYVSTYVLPTPAHQIYYLFWRETSFCRGVGQHPGGVDAEEARGRCRQPLRATRRGRLAGGREAGGELGEDADGELSMTGHGDGMKMSPSCIAGNDTIPKSCSDVDGSIHEDAATESRVGRAGAHTRSFLILGTGIPWAETLPWRLGAWAYGRRRTKP